MACVLLLSPPNEAGISDFVQSDRMAGIFFSIEFPIVCVCLFGCFFKGKVIKHTHVLQILGRGRKKPENVFKNGTELHNKLHKSKVVISPYIICANNSLPSADNINRIYSNTFHFL